MSKKKSLSPHLLFLTLPPLQGFSGETDFHLHQFLFSLFKYSSSNFPSSYPYNIFIINFPGNSPLLKSFSSAISIFSCLLTSTFILPLNSFTNSLACSRSFFLSYISLSAMNLFYHTKYFLTPLIFLLFNIFSTSHSSTPSTSIGFSSSFFYSSTCSLYCTIRLMFITR